MKEPLEKSQVHPQQEESESEEVDFKDESIANEV